MKPESPATPRRIDVMVRLTIRELTSADLGAVADFSGAAHLLSVREHLERAERGGVVYYAAALPSGVVVGKACLDFESPRPPEITQAAVHGLWQNLGIWTALMAACEDEARRRGHAAIHLGVDDRDTRPLRLYQRSGYEIVGEGPGSWDETDPDGTTHRVTVNEIFLTKTL